MDDGRTLRLQNHRLQQPAEQRKDEARERTLVIYMGQSEAMYTLQTVWTGCVYLMACNLLVKSVSSTERTWTETHHTRLYIHSMYMYVDTDLVVATLALA